MLQPGDVARSRCHVRAYVERAPQEAPRAFGRLSAPGQVDKDAFEELVSGRTSRGRII